MLRTWANSARYPDIASSTSSSGARPVVAASSLRRVSVSGLRCTTIPGSLEACFGSVKPIVSQRRLFMMTEIKSGGQPAADGAAVGVVGLAEGGAEMRLFVEN